MKNTSTNATNPFEGTTSQNAISAIAFRYLPFWPIFVFTIVVSLLISYIYIHYQTPIYEANSTILLKDYRTGGGDGANVLEALGVSASVKTVENEIEMLKSRTLTEQVVKDLGLYTQVYSKGTLRDVLIYPNPVKFIALNPNELQNSPNLPISFEYLPTKNYITISGKKYVLGSPVRTPYGDFIINPVKTLSNVSEQGYKGEFYLQIRTVKDAAKSILGALTVAQGARQSSLISLKLADQVPIRAEDILNDLVTVYNKAGIDEKVLSATNTLNFINSRLALVQRELSGVETEMQDYRTTQGIVDLSTEGRTYLANAQRNDDQLAQLQIQLDVLNQVEKYIVGKRNQSGTVPSTLGINDPILTQLLDKLYTAELELSNLKQTAGENSPPVAAVQERINQIKPSLLENLNALKQNLLATQRRIRSESGVNTSQLKTVPSKERKFLEISRQQAIKNNIYTLLLTKREEVELSRAAAVADSRIVNFAESRGAPIKPVPLNIYLFGLAVGVIIGISFVLIREQYNREVLFRSEIEKKTKATVLAELVHDTTGEAVVIKDGSRTVIAEQFRALRTALSFIGIQGDKKTILVTSSISGEGKSFTAVNLAVSLALTGKKVAIMEFDLRKPKISKMMDIKQEPGISNYMAGLATYQDINLSLESYGIPGLYILPAGTIPPNPTELMLNGKLDELIAKLKEEFDFILIDSPPIGLVTDAKILNKYVDVCLYMVRHKYTPKYYLNLIDHIYSNNELKSVNIIFNGLKLRGMLGSYTVGYGYGYGFGYGYGYGYTDEGKDVKKEAKGTKGLFKKS